LVYKYSNERGDRIFNSQTLQDLWNKGQTELGSVTFESAGYVARYAAKKLVHGNDDDHIYQPISKKSCKNAIGKKFLETYYKDIFSYGQVVLDNGTKSSIPRYYEKWLQKNHPHEWIDYVTKLKAQRIKKAEAKTELEKILTDNINDQRTLGRGHQIKHSIVRSKLIEAKFKQLQKHLKGDI
jgi:hypothetical protein